MRIVARQDGLQFYAIEETENLPLPYISTPVKAGFPSPAQDFLEEDIDLVAFLGMNKPNVYAVLIEGDFLLYEHAPDGSYLICDTSLSPLSNDLAIIELNGEYLVRTLVKAARGWILYTGNTHLNPVLIGEGDNFRIWGIVVQVILSTRHKPRSAPTGINFQEHLDLVALLNMHKPSVYVVRTDGDSMEDEHIINNSFLIVDRSLRPQPHDIAVAVLNGEFTVKKLIKSTNGWVLYAANNHYNPIPIKETDNFQVWGVVAHIVIDRKELRGRYA